MVNMEIIISAVDKASAVLEKVQRKMDVIKNKTARIAETFNRVGKGLAVAGAGMTAFATPFVAGMASAINKGIEFEQQMKTVQAVMGASQQDFTKLSQLAMHYGATTAYTASEVAEAMRNMAAAGMKTKQIYASLGSVLTLATATQSDLNLSSEIIISTLAQFNMKASQSARIIDVFSQAVANSPARLGDLQYSLKYVGALANSMGYSLEQTTAALMMLYKAGKKGEEAGTALREVLSRLVNTGVQNKLKALGINVLDSNGKLKGMGTILDEIKKKGLSSAQILSIFGTEAGTAINIMLTQGGDAYKKYVKVLDDSKGKAEKTADEMKNTVQYKIQALKSAIEGIKLSIFKDNKGQIKKFLDELIKAMPAIKKFVVSISKGMATVGKVIVKAILPLLKIFNNLPAPVKKAIGIFVGLVAAIAAIVGPILLVVGGFAMAISSISEVVGAIGGLSAAIGAVSGVISSVITVIGGIVLAINPVILIILAVAVAVAALYLAWKNNWFGIRDTINAVVKKIKGILSKLAGALKWVITEIKKHTKDIKKALFTALLGPFAPLKTAWDNNLFGIRDKLKKVFNEMISYLKSLPRRFYQAGVGMINSLKNGIESKINEIKQKILDLLHWIDNHLPHSPAKEGPLSRLDKVGPGFIDTIAEGINKHKSKIQNVVGGITTTMAINTRLGRAPTTSNVLNYGGDTQTNYNVAINVVGKSYDEQQLANHLNKLLKKQIYR
ncbi:phage tail tape measure protein [Methanothermococcus okinawensis]|uniref:Phage tail tape measure protein, TP901 family n=1 Tax=Methanothermococcus okinawensis (strain DSM 14208 / JCM 11175 / IH1) TaxID=647113 RepID=F8AKA7_METOI|nr:phage tail tape measure protein [Methanothermococcus okinawensis]AEH06307.1 phage tail tape measure protein, TP901 family [Methanothermococcus okinawensis IH1]